MRGFWDELLEWLESGGRWTRSWRLSIEKQLASVSRSICRDYRNQVRE
jgi:hypothetical protein